MNRMKRILGIALAAISTSAVPVLAQAPVGSSFTFQGQLKELGVPAGSTYDLRFRLYDALTGGTPIAVDCVDGVMPVDGLFTVDIDFGALAFDGDARWMEIAVRVDGTAGNCDGGSAYTALSPRQPLTAVPYALYALGGPGGGGTGFWQAVGSAIMNTNSGFVGIGRTAQVSGAEYFGIQAPAAGTNYGGMYIRTDSDQAKPFYGYKAGDAGSTAWTFLDGATGTWNLYNSGVRMTVDSSGRVGIGNSTPTARLDVVPAAGTWGIRVVNDGQNSALYATSSGGTAPTIYGTTASTAAGAVGVHGLVSGSSPGSGAVGVRGTISSTGNNGYGVYGLHNGGGYGVYGESSSTSAGAGVYGTGRYAVFGVANNQANGIGGVFAGGGAFGSGPSIWSIGDTLIGGGLRIGSAGLFDAPSVKLQVEGGSDANLASGGYLVLGNAASASIAMDNNEIMARNNGAAATLYLNNEGGDVRIGQNGGASCTVYVPVLAITGADVAEKFPLSDCSAPAEPGTVMEIDPENAGKLRVSHGAYNRRVAGVVSGAGDIPVGAILGNLPGHEDAPAIALSGRVWVRCDARTTAIEIGDLLTTSDLAGHAMKAADSSRSHGAVIGKAMTALEQGETGLVLVLVNLQ